MERVERIELSTKPWQGLVLPLAPYPHLKLDCILYMLICQASLWQTWWVPGDSNSAPKDYESSALTE